MRFLFASSVLLIVVAYAGYPICMYLRAKFWPHPIVRASIFPSVTIVMAVRNEEKTLLKKLRNLAVLDYPLNRLEVIVVSDGSCDGSNEILLAWQDVNRRVLILPKHLGKANALNQAMALAEGEIICFVDARQIIARDGLKNLVSNFADISVGCASGALTMGANPYVSSSDGVGSYWRLEKNIRNWEGLAGSTVGATGAFFAVRRDLLAPLPVGIILDDVYIPMQVARQGQRVVFDQTAVAWEEFSPSPRQEFRRKVRTLAGNYQLLQIAPWLLTHLNPLRVQFVCHKLLRLLVPFALLCILVSTISLRHGVYGLILALQIIFYTLAGFRILRAKTNFLPRISNVALTFLLLNTAAAVAFVYFITGRKNLWVR
jgi:poly-beta-1,6-N-acetyl-D-glucosamine synthase